MAIVLLTPIRFCMSKEQPTKRTSTSGASSSSPADIGFERELWRAADALRSNMDAAEYKHVVLGLIFLKYISDAFEARYNLIRIGIDTPDSEYFLPPGIPDRDSQIAAVLEDRDEYLSANVFWVPKEARWETLRAAARQPSIGTAIDDAMAAIERDNSTLRGVLPKDFARPGLDKQRLGQLIDLIGNVGLGQPENRARDILGRVYEYFLSEFASAEGKKGGQFYTPRAVVRLLVEMLAPYAGRVYDPCCGSGGMFVQSEKFILQHGGRIGDISIFGQESNYTTWRLARMNLAIRGIDAHITHGNSFHDDQHADLKADYIISNPPFNDSDWLGETLRDDRRWAYGVPPPGNANYAWIQHYISHLAPGGSAGFVMANGSMSSNQSGEGDIRRAVIEADLVDCMVALPGQLFYTTQIPVCLWFIVRDRATLRGPAAEHQRPRGGEVLFIDARNMGSMISRVQRDLTSADLERIADTYHNWRGDGQGTYVDVPGFCRSATIEEIRAHEYVLTPGRYVGAEEQEIDEEPFEKKMYRLAEELREQQAKAKRIDAAIMQNLKELGYGE